MGVQSLWPILAPTARPTPLPTLNRTRLAVDASIWIYQFLKAVRDKEGHALRNSHVVGFFRRICKLLYFGIKPVFVFDGGAPALKRQTVRGRRERREGRREDAVRTAGRLLAVQMKKRGEEEEDRRRRERERERSGLGSGRAQEEEVDDGQLVYVGELGMSAAERASTRKFQKKDAYHLPEISSLTDMGQPNDPRIMSAEELEEYARQFSDGEDVNLYDFSKIDFNGDFFQSLPAGDRYNILNAARLRSRLRMGLSKEQLEEMFPDRMAFSKFQIERVRERNELTQRLMNLNGMNEGILGTGQRIAGERGREYVLVKNEGVEGGWALGVVSTEKSGARNKPIDVDAVQKVEKVETEESEDEFEDVPVEGMNRLPKVKEGTNLTYGDFQEREMADHRRRVDLQTTNGASRPELHTEESEGLFVDDNQEDADLSRAIAMSLQPDIDEEVDEQNHLNRAIALSMQIQHAQPSASPEPEFEDVDMPLYEQRAVEAPKPISGDKTSGSMIAHIVNNRANAAVPKKRERLPSDSDSEEDMQAALKRARKGKRNEPAPVVRNERAFDGPLPFEKLGSIFGKSQSTQPKASSTGNEDSQDINDPVDDMAGGFDTQPEKEKAKPLPPWLVGADDIREQVQEQRERDLQLNAADRERAIEEERAYQREHGVIEIESEDEGSDVEVLEEMPQPRGRKEVEVVDVEDSADGGETSLDVEKPAEEGDAVSSPKIVTETLGDLAEQVRAEPPAADVPEYRKPSVEPAEEDEELEWSESDHGDAATKGKAVEEVREGTGAGRSASKSASPVFEDVLGGNAGRSISKSPSPVFEDVEVPASNNKSPFPLFPETAPGLAPTLQPQQSYDSERAAIDAEFDFSDPEDEELLTQLALEAGEHARFASTLNNKSAVENQATYEAELKALRSQQKKDRRDADEVSHIMITECQALLRLFGLPYITAPMEAEAQCAELVRLGLVDGIVTDDSDIFLFGGTRVYKNMFNSNKYVECYLLKDLEKELSLSRSHLIAIAHLLGSDYTEGLSGVGPVTAVEILSEFPDPSTGLKDFREWWMTSQHANHSHKDETTPFRRKFRRAQHAKLFLPPAFPNDAVTEAYLKPEVDSTTEPFQWGVPDLEKLREFLMATIGWSQERTDEVLVPVIRDMNRREQEGTQANITRYFEGSVGSGAKKAEGGGVGVNKEKGSRRMKDAVGKLKKKKAGAGSGNLGIESGALGETFADQAREWAGRNDLSFTEREKAKVTKKRGRRKRGAAMADNGAGPEGEEGSVAQDEAEGVVEENGAVREDSDADADMNMEDLSEDEDEYHEPRASSKKKGGGRGRGGERK